MPNRKSNDNVNFGDGDGDGDGVGDGDGDGDDVCDDVGVHKHLHFDNRASRQLVLKMEGLSFMKKATKIIIKIQSV